MKPWKKKAVSIYSQVTYEDGSLYSFRTEDLDNSLLQKLIKKAAEDRILSEIESLEHNIDFWKRDLAKLRGV